LCNVVEKEGRQVKITGSEIVGLGKPSKGGGGEVGAPIHHGYDGGEVCLHYHARVVVIIIISPKH